MAASSEKFLKELHALTEPKDILKFADFAEERTENYEAGRQAILHLATVGDDKLRKLTSSESQNLRNFLSVAYKHLTGALRNSRRSCEDFGKTLDEKDMTIVKMYETHLTSQLQTLCLEVIDLVENHFNDKNYTVPDESKEEIEKNDELKDPLERYVFYKKLIGDYYRYLSEVTNDEEHKKLCAESYDVASTAAERLGDTHPTRLGLALNYSVAKYEILGKKKEACQLAKTTFDNAIKSLESLSDGSYKDSTLIMQLLRDNLTLWQKEADDEAGHD